jgi:hypothetical protein
LESHTRLCHRQKTLFKIVLVDNRQNSVQMNHHHPTTSTFLKDLHPLFAFLIHYSVIIPSSIAVNDLFFLPLASDKTYPFSGYVVTTTADHHYFTVRNLKSHQCDQPHSFLTQIGPHGEVISSFLLLYALLILVFRLAAKRGVLRMAVFYEYTWLCNSTLLLGFIGLRTCRPLLVTGPVIAVSIDQLLWYIDLIGWTAR